MTTFDISVSILLMNPSLSGFEKYNTAIVSTAVVRAVPTLLHTITPEVSTGTVTLYDSATAAGTSAANRIIGFTGGTSVAQCFTLILDYQCKNGLVSVTGGTPIATLTIA